MDIEFIKHLSSEIALRGEAYNKALSLLQSKPKKVLRAADKTSLQNHLRISKAISFNRKKGAVLCLAVCLVLSERAYYEYKKLGIPEEIYYASMADITTWVNTAKKEENIDGILEISWIRHTLFLNLFKIGRMQYQFDKTGYLLSGISSDDAGQIPIPNKSNILNMHIPEGGKLSLDECKKSVVEAEKFFKKYFPEYDFKGFVCDSWLLDPKNKEFMREDSNIVKFSELFDVVYKTKVVHTEIVRRLWGENTYNLEKIKSFSADNDLRKRTRDYLLKGNKTGNGYGMIFLPLKF